MSNKYAGEEDMRVPPDSKQDGEKHESPDRLSGEYEDGGTGPGDTAVLTRERQHVSKPAPAQQEKTKNPSQDNQELTKEPGEPPNPATFSPFNIDLNAIKAAYSHCLDLPRSVIISSFFINLLGLALPLVILQIFDRVLPNQATETLAFLIIGLCGIVFLEGALKIARAYVMSWDALKMGFTHEIESIKRILGANSQDFGSDCPSTWIDRLEALAELNGFYGGPARLVMLDLPFALIFLTVIALVGGPLVMIPLAVIAAFASHTAVKGTNLHSVLQERSLQDGKRYDFIVECLNGIQTIKCKAMEPLMQRRFERLQQSTAQISFKTILYGSDMQSSGSLFANVTMISVVTVGSLIVMNGQLSIGALACCTLLSSRLVQPVLRGISVWSELQNVSISLERAQPLFGLPPCQPPPNHIEHIKGAITIRDLTCAKKNGPGYLFHNLNLTVEPGQVIGLRGDEASGKSLLIKAILGNFTAESGSVHVDGHNVTSPAYADIARSICSIGIGAPIFAGTVLENIAMFRTGTAIDAARTAATLIGLEDEIQKLPEGYDTIIGSGISDTLSEGFQQRICIARVIAQSPKILLFDEANTMLDHRSDAKLREGLNKLKGTMTILLVSNRPSLLAISDKIFNISDGNLQRVQADGSPLSDVNETCTSNRIS